MALSSRLVPSNSATVILKMTLLWGSEQTRAGTSGLRRPRSRGLDLGIGRKGDREGVVRIAVFSQPCAAAGALATNVARTNAT